MWALKMRQGVIINLWWVYDSPMRMGKSDIWKVMYTHWFFFFLLEEQHLTIHISQTLTANCYQFCSFDICFSIFLMKQTELKNWLLEMAFKHELETSVLFLELLKAMRVWRVSANHRWRRLPEPRQSFIRYQIQNHVWGCRQKTRS